MRKGRLCLLGSALIYGILPVFAKHVTISGCDSVTLVFLRSALSLPLLFIIMKRKGVDMHLSKSELVKTAILGAGGNAPAMVLLYSAYAISAVGVASMLHFVYPFIIVIACALLFREKIPLLKWMGTALAACGVILSLDMKTNALGAVLAVLSGVFYAFFVIYMDKSGIDGMNYLKLTFYISVIMSLAALAMCIMGDGINLPQNAGGWISSMLVSVLTTIFAIPLFQAGVKYEGAAEAGIISMTEPVTGIIIGTFLLGEKITLIGIVGCVLISIGIFCVEKA